VDLPAIGPAVDRFAARLDALAARGVDVRGAGVRGELRAHDDGILRRLRLRLLRAARPDLPPVASGGRYDALTRVLGRGRSIPAVGGVIRPALTLELRR
jgi:ATP phosphoribosyltransferase regulatory subunit